MGKHNGWNEIEIDLLKDEVLSCIRQDKALLNAFANTAQAANRNKSSVRNYYYTILRKDMIKNGDEGIKRRESSGFDVFTKEEIDMLLDFILKGTSEGKSVRACALELAKGDDKLMLRYQNKYRSLTMRHKEIVTKAFSRLNSNDKSIESENDDKKKDDNDLTLTQIKKVLDVDVPEFICIVNILYKKALVNEKLRKELIYTKAMLEGERKKQSRAEMMMLFYKEKLRRIMDTQIDAPG